MTQIKGDCTECDRKDILVWPQLNSPVRICTVCVVRIAKEELRKLKKTN